jgi:hypothetical protein
MTKSTAKPLAKADPQAVTLTVKRHEGDTDGQATARTLLHPDFRHGMALAQLHSGFIGQFDFAPSGADYADGIAGIANGAARGDLAFASRMLAAQAVTLDHMFAEATRRMAANMGNHPQAVEIYSRLALKAQTNSRATLEALVKLHQPREQTVRHVHVNEGGQAVIADQFHHHGDGAQGNRKNAEQSHAPADGAAGASPALQSPDPFGQGMPVASGQGQASMPDARRDKSRRA